MNRGHRRSIARTGVLGLLVPAVVGLALARAGEASTPYKTIASSGPLNSIFVGADASTQISHVLDGSTYEVYHWTTIPADYGTFLVVGGVLYAPDFNNHNGFTATGNLGTRTVFTPVSQSAVSGTGAAGDPYKVTTVVDAGATGLRITQTDSYIVGQESYRTDVTVANSNGLTLPVIIFRAVDCYLGGSDNGYGFVDGTVNAVGCSKNANNIPPARVEELVPLSTGSNYFEDFYATVWAKIGTKTVFPNTCQCATSIDNGAGLSWSIAVPGGGQVSLSHLTVFSPVGALALTTTKTADSGDSGFGTSNGYTITVSNPNSGSVDLGSISDDLPTGFTYTPGSTTGATTSDPTITSQHLAWAGPFSVPGQGNVTLHFNVTVPSVAGTYYNQATADAGSATIAPTGATAPILVHAVLNLSDIQPTSGPSVGGTPVTITVASDGSAFQDGAVAKIGGAVCAITNLTPTSLTCTTGPRAPGTVEVKVTNPDGGVGTLENAFTYFCDAASPTADVSGSTTLCGPGTPTDLTVTMTGVPPWNLVWSDGFIEYSIQTSPHIRSVSPAVTTLYQVFAVVDQNCAGAGTGGANVIVAAPLTGTVVATPTTICPGSGVTLRALLNGTPPFHITWSDGAMQTTSQQSVTRVVNPTVTTTYSITSLTDANGCPASLSGSVLITVASPSASITTPSATCPGSLGNSASVPDAGQGATYSWFVTGGSITAGQGTSSITYTAGAGPTLTVGVSVTVPPGCNAQSSKQVGATNPTAAVIGSSTLYAAPSADIQVSLTGTPPWTLTWSDALVQSGILTSPATRTVTPLRTTSYSPSSVSNGTCAQAATGTVQVVPQGVGDVNADGKKNVTDVFYLINFLFAGGPAPLRSGDVNADNTVNVNDVFYLVNYLFAGGPPPPQ